MISKGFMRDVSSEWREESVGIKWNGPICARLKLHLGLMNVTTVFKTYSKKESV